MVRRCAMRRLEPRGPGDGLILRDPAKTPPFKDEDRENALLVEAELGKRE
jgi:hypothetical protein